MALRDQWNINGLYADPVLPPGQATTSAAAERNLTQTQAMGNGRNPGASANNPGGGGYQGAPAYNANGGAGTTGSSNNSLGGTWGESSQWYGQKLSDYGAQVAQASPEAFFDIYAQNQLGLDSGSSTGSWLANTYDPYSIAAATGAGPGMENRLAQGSQFMNIIGRPGVQFFNPGALVSGALQQFAKGINGSGNNQLGPQLAGQDPYTQLQTIINFLGQALMGTMDPKSLETYLGFIQAKGMQIVSSVINNPNDKGGGLASFERGGNNMATRLLQALGPNGGL